eukprot:5108871-Prymnesium_polylepis.1
MSVSEHEGNGDEGRSGRVRAPVCVWSWCGAAGVGGGNGHVCLPLEWTERQGHGTNKGCVHASSASPGGNLMCR